MIFAEDSGGGKGKGKGKGKLTLISPNLAIHIPTLPAHMREIKHHTIPLLPHSLPAPSDPVAQFRRVDVVEDAAVWCGG